MLIVFGGLPGAGKTTLARLIAQQKRATYLRIDSIEQAVRASGMLAGEVGPSGYLVGYALAEANLALGQDVVVDSVNPLGITRDAWRRAAANASSACIDIEVVCSDLAEHRRRVETRETDVAGLQLPSWAAVQRRDYEAWDRPRLVLDTAGRGVADTVTELRDRIGRWQGFRPRVHTGAAVPWRDDRTSSGRLNGSPAPAGRRWSRGGGGWKEEMPDGVGMRRSVPKPMRDADAGTLIAQQRCGTVQGWRTAPFHPALQSCRKGWFAALWAVAIQG